MPAAITQFTRYDVVQRDNLRIGSDGGYGTPLAFTGQMNHCGEAFWTVRWRTIEADISVIAFRAPYDADTTNYPLETFNPLPESGTGGYLSGYICERPAFTMANPGAASLVDIVVEWQYWDAAP